VLDVISKGAAQSWQMENRGKTMVADKFDFGFAVDWMRKDLGICLDEARNNGATLPVTSLVDQFYGRVQQRGGGRWDTSSLIRLLGIPPDASRALPPRARWRRRSPRAPRRWSRTHGCAPRSRELPPTPMRTWSPSGR
jgi:hypothetical protein